MSDTSNLANIRAAREGDSQAYGVLVRAHHNTVAGIAFAITGSSAAVDDIVQDTFLLAWKKLESLEEAERFSAWLCTIARNLSKNWIRSDAYRRALQEAYSKNLQEAPYPSTEEKIVQSERYANLRKVLESVSPSHREALVLFYLQEFSVKEIAAILNVTMSNVKKRLERGRQQLRKYLEDDWKTQFRKDSDSGDDVARQILAGLAVGPALPLEMYVSNGLVASTQLGGGSMATVSQSFTKGVLAMSAKKSTFAGAVLFLALTGLFLTYRVTTNDDVSRSDTTDTLPSQANSMRSLATDADQHEDSMLNPSEDAEEIVPETEEEETGADGEGALSFARADNDKEKKVRDETPIEITGIVFDEWSTPVSGANVVLAFGLIVSDAQPVNRMNRQYAEMGDPAYQYSAVTDGTGRYTVTGAFRETAGTIFARSDSAKGTSRFAVTASAATRDFDVTMKSGVLLVGQVFSSDGEPIPGAYVTSLGFVFGNSARSGNLDAAISNVQGIFEMVFPEEGATALRIVSTAGQTLFRDVPVGAPEIVPLYLNATGSLSGVIRHGDASPAAGKWVSLDTRYSLSSASGGSSVSGGVGTLYGAVTAVDGSYEISDVASGLQYSVTVTEPRVSYGDEIQALSPKTDLGEMQANEEKVWDYSIQDFARIAGFVRGTPSGGPLANVEVYLYDVANGTTVTNDDGSYELKVAVIPGTYRMGPKYEHVSYSVGREFHSEEIQLDHGDDVERTFTLPDPCEISLRVVDGFGEPVENADVSPEFRVEFSTNGFGPIGSTDSAGGFVWSMMPPVGTFSFRITADGYSGAKSQDYIGEPGVAYAEEVIVLYQKASIEGYAVNASGEPLARTSLLGRVYVDDVRTGQSRIVTDDEGYFVVKNSLPATTVELELTESNRPSAERGEWHSGLIKLEADMITSLGVITIGTPGTESGAPEQKSETP